MHYLSLIHFANQPLHVSAMFTAHHQEVFTIHVQLAMSGCSSILTQPAASQLNIQPSGFGGLAVSMLPSGTQDRGFKPGRSRQIFSGVKILKMPSFGREVKQLVPCRTFAARKRTLLDYVEVGSLRPNYSDISCSKFPPSLTGGSSDRVGSRISVEGPLHSSSMGALWS
jgi:hypothetical protein